MEGSDFPRKLVLFFPGGEWMGRNKEPIDLIMAKGNRAHKTKAEIEQRKKEEVKPMTDKIEPPVHLSRKQKNRFKYLASELLKAKIMTNLDVESLGHYVMLEDQYKQISVEATAMDIKNPGYADMIDNQGKVFRMMEKMSDKLCLNIVSRTKVSVPTEKEKEPENKFNRFKNG